MTFQDKPTYKFEIPDGGYYNIRMTVYVKGGETIMFHKAHRTIRTITKPPPWKFWGREVVEETYEPVPADFRDVKVAFIGK
jgi:hypothetical protein